jgi:dihydrofolate synthase/folylpolyglutamate synthase
MTATKIEQLYARTKDHVSPGIERSQMLLAALHNPQYEFPVIHIAGTNGKGSVANVCHNILSSFGLKTGLYTSPHLLSFNERIRINSELIADTDLESILDEVMNIVTGIESGSDHVRFSFFEITTAIAFLYFKYMKIQAAVIETGMGGRWDSTNVVGPGISVITTIDYDHQEFLGNTIAEIAAEKAGIIKKGCTIVSGYLTEDALSVISSRADECGARHISVPEYASLSRCESSKPMLNRFGLETPVNNYGLLTTRLLGQHQVQNIAVAVTAVEMFLSQFHAECPPEIIKKVISEGVLPARMQPLMTTVPVFLDSAHNPAGISSLLSILNSCFSSYSHGMVLGMCADKDINRVIDLLSQHQVSMLWIVPLNHSRGADPCMIYDRAVACGLRAQVCDLNNAVHYAKGWAAEDGHVVTIAGSIFLAAEVLDHHEWFKE